VAKSFPTQEEEDEGNRLIIKINEVVWTCF